MLKNPEIIITTNIFLNIFCIGVFYGITIANIIVYYYYYDQFSSLSKNLLLLNIIFHPILFCGISYWIVKKFYLPLYTLYRSRFIDLNINHDENNYVIRANVIDNQQIDEQSYKLYFCEYKWLNVIIIIYSICLIIYTFINLKTNIFLDNYIKIITVFESMLFSFSIAIIITLHENVETHIIQKIINMQIYYNE